MLDRVLELNPDTPILKTRGRDGVSLDLLLGLDTRLFATQQEVGGWLPPPGPCRFFSLALTVALTD